MKDEMARARLDDIESVVGDLERKECPKCKHLILAMRSWRITQSCFQRRFQCLICGSEFTCSKKDVCELIEEVSCQSQ